MIARWRDSQTITRDGDAERTLTWDGPQTSIYVRLKGCCKTITVHLAISTPTVKLVTSSKGAQSVTTARVCPPRRWPKPTDLLGACVLIFSCHLAPTVFGWPHLITLRPFWTFLHPNWDGPGWGFTSLTTNWHSLIVTHAEIYTLW